MGFVENLSKSDSRSQNVISENQAIHFKLIDTGYFRGFSRKPKKDYIILNLYYICDLHIVGMTRKTG
jgi:hypothetical protein